jgi:hypothetical protein
MNEIIINWNHIFTKDITLLVSTKTKLLSFFADDQIIRADTEYNLQAVFSLRNILTNVGVEISQENLGRRHFWGKTQLYVRSLWITNVYQK